MAGVKGRSGGARPGSGPKRRDPKATWLAGAGARPPLSVVPPAAPDEPRKRLECPKDAPPEVREVWRALASHAIAEGTLTERTVLAFLLLCRNVVLERKLAAAPLTCAGPDHRGLLARVEVAMARFRLAPDGKPVLQAEPEDEWAQFDVIQGGKA